MPPRRANPGRTLAVAVGCILTLAAFGLCKSWLSSSVTPAADNKLLKRDLRALDDDNLLCRKVHNAPDQCSWIKENCQDDDVGLLSYLSLYFCTLPHLKAVAFTIIALWSILLFSTIGIAASDFFCVNLSTIANLFGMSESMAGVTFLAFGNGSPDVFSTFAAIRSNSGSLAVGELIGAAGFITAVVSGSMALVRPFKVARRSFVRDVTFFIVAIAFSMVFVANGKLELWECATMVAFYVFYVVVVVLWHWWLAQRRKRREQQAIARGYYVDAEAEGELDFEGEYHDEEDAPARRRASTTAHPTATDLDDLESTEAQPHPFDELEEETERERWMGELSSNMRLTRTPLGERRNVFNPIRPSLVGALEFQSVLQSLRKSKNITTYPLHPRRFSDGPALTLAQQASRAHSTTSDPEPVSNIASRSASPGPSSQQLQVDGPTQSRGRAKSANAADLLGLSPSTWNRRQRSRSNLSSPRPVSSGSRYSDYDSLTAPSRERSQPTSPLPQVPEQPSPPLLTVDPPPEEQESYQAPSDRRRAGSSDLLDPQPGSKAVRPRSPSPAPLDGVQALSRSRPRLRITPPTPQPDVSQFPALRSPSLSCGTQSPHPTNIPSGDNIPSPESMYPVYSQNGLQTKPLRWWPYSIFVPPEVIWRTLFPTLQRWRDKNWLGKLTGIASAPSFFLLTITLPVVEPEAEEPDSADSLHSSPTAVAGNKPSSLLSGSQLSSAGPGSGPDALAHVAVSTETRQHHKDSLPKIPEQRQSKSSQPTPLAENHPHAAVQSSRDWNRWLVLVQCYTAPFFILLATWANFFEAEPSFLLKPSIYCVLGSTVAFGLLLLTTRADRPPRWHFILCFVGFTVSVTWISSIANEVVGVLKAIGVIFNISDAILGLTIFAVGNSMGDLVADITVARLGYPVMALSACFGGPMLNILLGIGLSGLYMVIHKADHRHHKHPDQDLKFKPYKVEVSVTLLISAVALLVTLIGLLIVVPLNKWTMDRKIGIGLIVLWVIATAGNLGVELSGIGQALS